MAKSDPNVAFVLEYKQEDNNVQTPPGVTTWRLPHDNMLEEAQRDKLSLLPTHRINCDGIGINVYL